MVKMNPIEILMADDDKDDQLLTKKALEKSRLINNLHFVDDGVHLVDYLYHRNGYEDKTRFPRPDLILLDLNMPRMDGREALRIIKNDESLKRMPVIILTTSQEDKEILNKFFSSK